MASENFDISKLIQQNNNFSQKTLLSYVWRLSVPSIFAQISSIVMQYIDAAMVGHIGANAAAAIGLVSPSMWLFGGICHSFSTGFIVQVAQAVGAGERQRAKQLLRESIVACIAVAGIVAAISCAISGKLPVLLGAEHAIHHDASIYFFCVSVDAANFSDSVLVQRHAASKRRYENAGHFKRAHVCA